MGAPAYTVTHVTKANPKSEAKWRRDAAAALVKAVNTALDEAQAQGSIGARRLTEMLIQPLNGAENALK